MKNSVTRSTISQNKGQDIIIFRKTLFQIFLVKNLLKNLVYKNEEINRERRTWQRWQIGDSAQNKGKQKPPKSEFMIERLFRMGNMKMIYLFLKHFLDLTHIHLYLFTPKLFWWITKNILLTGENWLQGQVVLLTLTTSPFITFGFIFF